MSLTCFRFCSKMATPVNQIGSTLVMSLLLLRDWMHVRAREEGIVDETD